jgi:hypothetical protein
MFLVMNDIMIMIMYERLKDETILAYLGRVFQHSLVGTEKL